MRPLDLLAVGLAGGAGAVARFVLDSAVRHRITSRLPVATIAINLSGSFLLGLLSGLVLAGAASPTLTLVAGSGFCGGYTTFSTASFETVRLAEEGAWTAAASNVLITLLGALAGAGAGLAIGWR